MRALLVAWSMAAAMVLAGCGFEPLYGERRGQAITADLAAVRVAPISDRVGQILRNQLLDRLGSQGPARYELQVGLSETRADLGILRDATTTYARLNLSSTFVLRDVASNAVLYTGTARAMDSYNVAQDGYATLVSEQDARERAIRVLGDEILTRLALFLDRTRRRIS